MRSITLIHKVILLGKLEEQLRDETKNVRSELRERNLLLLEREERDHDIFVLFTENEYRRKVYFMRPMLDAEQQGILGCYHLGAERQ